MKRLLVRLDAFINGRFGVPLLLLAVTVLAYGLLIPQLGFYWDDLPMSWIRYELGPEAMARYFSNNRPLWGLLYQVTTRLIPHDPVSWQVFALFMRWLTGILAWAVIGRIWRGRAAFALGAGLFFLLYPGFNQQWGAYLYSHFFIVLCFYLLSYYFMLRALREPRCFKILTGLALLFSALNLWMMEYFFFAELVRPFIIFVALHDQKGANTSHFALRTLVRRTFVLWIPYLIIWLADLFFRAFVFNNQVYQTSLLSDLRADPIPTLLHLIQMMLASFWTVSGAAWGQVFQLPSPSIDGPLTTVMVVVVIAWVFVISFYVLRIRPSESRSRFAVSAISLGLVSIFFAGWPFWLIDFPPSLAHPASRFTLPFMLGVSLILGGLLELIPHRLTRFALAAALIGLAAGRQAFWADSYRADWVTQKNLFWQMTWRAPSLAPNTTVLLNEGALSYYSDISLAGALNWIYAPDLKDGEPIPYVLFHPTNRRNGALPVLRPGLPVNYDYLAGKFSGNTSQVVVFYYQPPGCLRLLDSEIDSVNHFIPDETWLREAAALSSSEWILPEGRARAPQVYEPEPTHGWCYYFERADLARQQGDWVQVVEFGNKAFALDDYPNDPVERFVFIEGYAHAGEWGRAQELSMASYRVSREYMGPLLCTLWERIIRETPESADKQSAVKDVMIKFGCSS